MPTERRETRKVTQCRSDSEICADGFLKGYSRLHWIADRAAKPSAPKKMQQLMHHFNATNLMRAFHSLHGNKAAGIDSVTKSEFKKNADENIQALTLRIHEKKWFPKPSREVLIPKSSGGTRALAVGCLEDKVVQTLAARILDAVFDARFHRHSFGFRPNKSAHMAVHTLYRAISKRSATCVVVEMDVEKFFDSMSHEWLMKRLEENIEDTHFLSLISRMLKSSTLHGNGLLADNVVGTPQGSPVSPILANIYLHFLLDAWFQKNHAHEADMVRYADDAVFVFDDMQKATQFQAALKARMAEGSLSLNEAKSGITVFHEKSPQGIIPFLGFEFFWGVTRVNKRTLKVKTSTKKLGKAIESFTDWVKAHRNKLPGTKLWRIAASKVRGHLNYFGVVFNTVNVNNFHFGCLKSLFKWLNRRSQKASFDYEAFKKKLSYLKFPLPPPGHLLKDITSVSCLSVKPFPSSRMRKLRTSGSSRSVGRVSRPAFT